VKKRGRALLQRWATPCRMWLRRSKCQLTSVFNLTSPADTQRSSNISRGSAAAARRRQLYCSAPTLRKKSAVSDMPLSTAS
jgi:hypothetical protein